MGRYSEPRLWRIPNSRLVKSDLIRPTSGSRATTCEPVCRETHSDRVRAERHRSSPALQGRTAQVPHLSGTTSGETSVLRAVRAWPSNLGNGIIQQLLVPTPPGTSLEEIVAAGKTVLESEGIEGLAMRAVAGIAGVRASSPYKHVAGRASLVRLIVESVAGELGRTLESSVAGADPMED